MDGAPALVQQKAVKDLITSPSPFQVGYVASYRKLDKSNNIVRCINSDKYRQKIVQSSRKEVCDLKSMIFGPIGP
jgi:hypothetical protein